MNIEQRIESLEKTVKNINLKLFQDEFKDTSKYLNQYEYYKINDHEICNDFLYSPDDSKLWKNDTDTIPSELKDSIYPSILGSWDEDKIENKNDIKIKNVYGKIIYKFPIYHHEWEMDGYGYIVENQRGSRQIIMTDHGKPYVSCLPELKIKILSYTDVIQKTEKAVKCFLGETVQNFCQK